MEQASLALMLWGPGSACLPALHSMQQLQYMIVFVPPCILCMVAIMQCPGFWAFQMVLVCLALKLMPWVQHKTQWCLQWVCISIMDGDSGKCSVLGVIAGDACFISNGANGSVGMLEAGLSTGECFDAVLILFFEVHLEICHGVAQLACLSIFQWCCGRYLCF